MEKILDLNAAYQAEDDCVRILSFASILLLLILTKPCERVKLVANCVCEIKSTPQSKQGLLVVDSEKPK